MIPVFDGLLPSPYNDAVLTLLFRLAEWHALAKPHMHTESTLGYLDASTKMIGQQLHHFCNFTCPAFETVELPKEAAACGRRKNAMTALITNKPAAMSESSAPQASSSSNPVAIDATSQPAPKSKHRAQSFNLNTVKTHFLGDYSKTIQFIFHSNGRHHVTSTDWIILNSFVGRAKTLASEAALWMNKQVAGHQPDDST